MALLPQLIEFFMTRGLRQEQAETQNLQQELLKAQQKQINLNIKEKEQILEFINSLPPELQTSARLNPEITGLLSMLTNRGQGQKTQPKPTKPRIGMTPQGYQIAEQPKVGLLGMIANQQLLGGMTPQDMILDIIRKKTGAGESVQPVRTQPMFNPNTQKYEMAQILRNGQVRFLGMEAPPELATQAIEGAGGEKGVLLYDKLRGFRPAMPGAEGQQYIQTAPGTMEKPIKETSLPLWVHPETLESPPIGTSPEAAEKAGYRRVSTEAKNRIDAAKGMKEVLVKLGDLMKDVFPPKGGMGERITGAPSRMLGARTQYDPQAAQLESFINGTVAPIIRSFGEKGNLSETDVKRAINLMPKISDSADVAWGKFNNLIELINNIQKSAIAGKPGQPGLSLQPGKKQADPLGLR